MGLVSHRYKIRAFRSLDQDAVAVEIGMIVSPIERSFALLAGSLDEAERKLCENVEKRRLTAGQVYQICPTVENPEPIRAIAINDPTKVLRVTLHTESGVYSERRLVRLHDEDLHC